MAIFRKKLKIDNRPTGIHYLRRNKRMITIGPGETIECEPYELGGAINLFERLDAPTLEEKALENIEPTLMPKHAGGVYWDVINIQTGKPINDKRLNKEEAYQLAGIKDIHNVK